MKRIIKCAACRKRVHDHEPDLVLQCLDGSGQPRYFHTRCGVAAYAAAMKSRSLHPLTVRHIEEVAN